MIRTLLSVLALGFSFSANAADVPAALVPTHDSFMIDSNMDFGGRVYYNCDSVEVKVKELLRKMGAQNVKVYCHGGVDDFNPPIAWEASVDLSFSSYRHVTDERSGTPAQWYKVSIRSHDDCQLLSQVFKRVKRRFEIQNLKGPNRCGSINKSFRAEFLTLGAI